MTLTIPIPYDEIVLEKLDSIRPPDIQIDTDITSAVQFLQELTGDIECNGKPIRILLTAGPSEIARAPKISFSGKGLSAKEVLLIICNRASLDYRIEETTIYLQSKQ